MFYGTANKNKVPSNFDLYYLSAHCSANRGLYSQNKMRITMSRQFHMKGCKYFDAGVKSDAWKNI